MRMEHWTRRPLERTSRASEWRAGVGQVSTEVAVESLAAREAALSEVEEEGSSGDRRVWRAVRGGD